MSAIVEHSDCRAYLATLATNSLDACTTDPPYELNFMGREWDRSGIANQVELWREVYRVLKPGAHLVVFGGTRTYHRMVCAIEDAGFEIRDTLQWLYGSGFPKSKNIGGGIGTSLKPAHEPICLARKPVAKTVAATIAAYSTGGINVEACRVGTDAGWSYPNGRGGSGWHGVEALSRNLDTPMAAIAGRWPPNLLLSHSASCNGHCAPDCPVAALDRQSGERKSGGSMHERSVASHGIYSKYTPGRNSTIEPSTGGASRFYPILNYDPAYDDPFLYCAKAGKKERGAGNNHPTVKPVALCRWLVRLVTPLGGTALDPFAGSGSFGVACVLEGRHYKGCDQDAEYVEIANRRIAATQPALIGV